MILFASLTDQQQTYFKPGSCPEFFLHALGHRIIESISFFFSFIKVFFKFIMHDTVKLSRDYTAPFMSVSFCFHSVVNLNYPTSPQSIMHFPFEFRQ